MNVLSRTSRDLNSGSVDRALLFGIVTLALFGDLMIYSATKVALANAGYDPAYYLKRQTMWICIGLVVMWIVSRVDHRRFELLATPAYIASIGGLVGVIFFGSSALGAQRWFNIGFFQVQPSEFMVLSLILTASAYSARRPQGLVQRDVIRILFMAALPMGIIAIQPDLGTAIIISVTIGIVIVIAGVPPRYMALLAVLGVVGAISAVAVGFLQKYQLARLTAFVNQNSSDPLLADAIYHVDNAKNAIGAGGIKGMGLFNGLQTNLGYVPEQRTDFIFTAIGEQLGLIGSLIFLALLASVAYRIFVISKEAKEQFGRLLCVGIFVFFSFSCFQNIGMTMGIMPVTGIPLPMVSYGGTAALVFSGAMGMVLSVSRRRGN
ncbi:MAG: FtsW/RodA/SpoVE family cell cycle protein [Actinobacteria bacterium]|nr:FtsW/RodA/SpoVE family cell cycle protein [Actinomycetota bacterium]